MDEARKKQEEEIIRYLGKEFFMDTGCYKPFHLVLMEVVRVLMRRYDLFDTEDMPREG